MSGAKRHSLSINEKVKIVELLTSGKSNADVRKLFRLSSSTVSSIWAKRNRILEAASGNRNVNLKRLRKPLRPDVDDALLKWITAQRNSNIPITGPMLQEKAEDLANLFSTAGSSTETIREDSNKKFVCTTSWVDRFKKRYNIKVGKLQGQDQNVETNFWFPDWLKLQNDNTGKDNSTLSKWVAKNQINEFAGSDLDDYVEAVEENHGVITNEETTTDHGTVEMVNENSDILEQSMITCDEKIQEDFNEHEIKTEHIYLSSASNEGESPASATSDYASSERNIAGKEPDRTGEDQFEVFGTYVASELKNLKSDFLRKKLKRRILQAIIEISEEDDG